MRFSIFLLATSVAAFNKPLFQERKSNQTNYALEILNNVQQGYNMMKKRCSTRFVDHSISDQTRMKLMVQKARAIVSYNKMFGDSLDFGMQVTCFSLMEKKETDRLFPITFGDELGGNSTGGERQFSKRDSGSFDGVLEAVSKIFTRSYGNRDQMGDYESESNPDGQVGGPVSPILDDGYYPIDPTPNIPPSYGGKRLDWRNFYGTKYVTSVKNQLRCGSCWAFASVGAVESFMLINGMASQDIDLSEQFVLDCTNPGNLNMNSCKGGLSEDGLTLIAKSGISVESSRSYRGLKDYCQKSYQERIVRPQFVPNYVVSKSPRSDQNVWAIINALKKGPVTVYYYMTEQGMDYGAGILKCHPSTQGANHAVLLVGYDMTGEEKYWILKNSWGPRWGINGYLKLSMDPRYDCNVSRTSVIGLNK